MTWNEVALVAPVAAAAFNVLLSFRAWRSLRWNSEARKIIFAYEKELLSRGIRDLPPRCVLCCCVLPNHMRGCDMQGFYEEADRVMRILTRPPIKYFPKGTKPPDLGGKGA